MSIENNKRFFKGIRNAGNSRKSILAKQAISAICGDAPEKEAIPIKETTFGSHFKETADIRNTPSTELSSDLESRLKKIVEDAMSKFEITSSDTASRIESFSAEVQEETKHRRRLEDQLKSHGEKIAYLEQQLESQKDAFAKQADVNAVCECCEKTDVSIGQLVKIDSGQMICKDCLSELRS